MATGTVKPTRLETPCRLWPGRVNDKGYGVDGHGRLAHRIVVEETEGRSLTAGEIVMHRCDNPPCIEYGHLRRATQADNVADRDAKGRRRAPRGEDSVNAKLTWALVAEIRSGTKSERAWARQLDVSRTTVHKARTGETWRYMS